MHLLGTVFNIQRMSLHDGPGIRTTVFLKGCPLQCDWCQNPESLSLKTEVGLRGNLCNQCLQCLKVCPETALSFDDGAIHISRARCTACGKCIEVCQPEALGVYGKSATVEEVFEIVRRDTIFYQGSGGGVTASGGEPLVQPAFVLALFQKCKAAGIPTCLDTAGYIRSTKMLRSVLQFTDYILFDIKHMDAKTHLKFTGRANHLILNNARIVCDSGIPVLFRMPLIPGVNDTLDNIMQTAQFIKTLGNHLCLELVPYHMLGLGKYEALGRRYRMENVKPPTAEHIEDVKQAFEKYGVPCSVSR